jgi:hypothetical protein
VQVVKDDKYEKYGLMAAAISMLIPVLIVIVCGALGMAVPALAMRLRDQKYASEEASATRYGNADYWRCEYPQQIQPLVDESMRDGVLTNGEYEELDRVVEVIRAEKNKRELMEACK